MTTERVQRRIDRLLEQADEALDRLDWGEVRARSQAVLNLDPTNQDALTYLAAAARSSAVDASGAVEEEVTPPSGAPDRAGQASTAVPASFASGRYAVRRFLGEGGKKQVYLAHDTLLDRDVAFALIKTEGLDETGRARIKREAQAMGRLGSHPHIVSVFDMGEEGGQPCIVTELMGGGDVEGLIEKASDHRPPLERTLEIAIAVCRGLDFAHSQGIVHRDLKPGNVWLTSDGVAKIGDFGLAVAIDRTRLTQAGMMVGTVSYMPPEQAMGGEVTPRSDLYSLGAMLYETITGRPPFIGDESVAIIGQHLNTPPVAPSWHRPDCPAGLEALILRLLEKDPGKRPESAGEVREALLAIERSAALPSPPEEEGRVRREGRGDEQSPAALDNPLYRRTFVGREAELHQLQTAFDAAVSGRGSLAMVVGEPGIGKTALCEQLATYVTLRGGRVLVGHCYEEGSLSLPYLPFVEAMRSYVLQREPEALKQDLGSSAGEVARIVSEIRDRVPVELPQSGDPEEDRYRLYQAVTSFLHHAATVQPLALVLEDLQDADRGTLDLLTHLSRNLAGSRLLIVGNYRDIEVDRSHPLSATLAELRRAASFQRLLLRGLTADEVQRMLSVISGQEAAWGLAEAVHRQTEGNPLFVQEVLRYLVEEGLIKREDGRWQRASTETPVEMSIPEGLRDVIGKRLSRLSPDCNRLLAIAAVIGRDFRLATLQAVAGAEEEMLVSAMEEATRVAVLSESASGRRVRAIEYRFAHAFFRQTLYEELSAPRRLRLHQEVARTLEGEYAGRLEEHAAELAEHFAQSTDAADLGKALGYAELAAGRALSVYAYGEAARHWELALEVQEVLAPSDTVKRCDLLLALGDALVPAGQPLRAAETVTTEALALAESLEDHGRASRACHLALAALLRYGGNTMVGTAAVRRWAELADRHAAPGTGDRSYADSMLGRIEFVAGRVQGGMALIRQALALARELGDADLFFEEASMAVGLMKTPEGAEENRLLAEEVVGCPRDGARARTVGQALWNAAAILLCHGERERAEAIWQDITELAARTRDPAGGSVIREILLATMAGGLEQALAARADAFSQADQIGASVMGRTFGNGAALNALLYLGRAEEALEDISAAVRMAGAEELPLFTARRSLCLALAGRRAEAAALLGELLSEGVFGPEAEGAGTDSLVNMLEAAVLIEDRGIAGGLARRLAVLSGAASCNGTVGTPTCIGRHLGDAAALLGDRETARRSYAQALELATRIRHRPEMALAHLGLAEVMLDDADEAERARALQHLDTAVAELREMKMQPALERALRHKEVLKA